MKNTGLIFLVLYLAGQWLEAVHIENGTIEGAPYKIVRPEPATGPLLLLAHGFRPEAAPLSADFDHENGVMLRLLEAGWTIASTGYRHNGWIVEEAMEDLLNLKQRVAEIWEPPTETYLLGGSLGGLIITLLAEQHADAFDGAVAMGAALMDSNGEWRKPFSFSPGMPVLFLTNQSELTGPRRYFDKAADAPVPSAIWVVRRDGHTNINFAEQEAALEAVVHWARAGGIIRERDGTIKPMPESVAIFEDGSAKAPVLRIHPIYGNLTVAFVADDLERLGIEQGERFQLEFGKQSVSVLLGTTYGDVPVGDWVAFPDAEGTHMIVRNFADAAGSLGLEEGSILRISLPDQ